MLEVYESSAFIHKLLSRGMMSWPTGTPVDSKEEFLRFCLLSFPTNLHSLDEHNLRVTYVFGIGQLGQSIQYEHEAKTMASVASSIQALLNSSTNGFQLPHFTLLEEQTTAVTLTIDSCVSELSKLSSWAVNQMHTWLLTSVNSSGTTAKPLDISQAENVRF